MLSNTIILLAMIFGIFIHPSFSKRKMISHVIGGRAYMNATHKSIVDGKLDKSKMIEVVFESPAGLCSGTIIGDRFILTAAHCFFPENSPVCSGADETAIKSFIPAISTFQIYIEGTCHPYEGKECDAESQGKLIAPKTFYILKEYFNSKCTSADLAIIELQQVIGDHGATLSNNKVLPNAGDFFISGFGQDPSDTDATGHLLKSVTLTAQTCVNAYHDSICTVEIDKDACSGDSGSSLLDEKNVIYGVVSSGQACSLLYAADINHKEGGEPVKQFSGGIFTSVSYHLGFICSIIGTLQGCPSTPETAEPYITVS